MRGRESLLVMWLWCFGRRLERMKKMLMSASYIVQRGKMKKRLAGGVIRPTGGGVLMRQNANYQSDRR
jgi:hypothetical protein